jgi:peptidoglycan/xylan/chitin deacetylase (PgdA/CDA1 family)
VIKRALWAIEDFALRKHVDDPESDRAQRIVVIFCTSIRSGERGRYGAGALNAMNPASYGPFPYSPIIRRPRLVWPDGAHVALWVIPNIEFFSLAEKVPLGSGGTGVPVPDVPSWSARDYGNRVGVFRLMEVLDRHGIRATVALNADLCAHHPEIIEEGQKRDWEWMGHNETNTRRLNEAPPGEEAGIIERTLSKIEKAIGRRPVGWLGSGLQETWNTLDHLVAEGCEYVSDWTNDDQPYVMTLGGGRRLIAMPYSHEINDKPAFEKFHRTADEFRDMICRQFDVLYREGAQSGRVMAIAIHPYLTGVPHRIDAFDAALAHVCRHAGVWKATGAEVARHFAAQAK